MEQNEEKNETGNGIDGGIEAFKANKNLEQLQNQITGLVDKMSNLESATRGKMYPDSSPDVRHALLKSDAENGKITFQQYDQQCRM